VSIWPMAVVRGDVSTISIGAGSNIQDAAVLHVTHDGPYSDGEGPLSIGAEVTVGHQAMLHACTIGDRCLIGMSAIIMDGAVLENEILIAAGSVVPPNKKLESRSLYRGNPVKRIRDLKQDEIEMLAYSARHYVKLKNSYLEELDPASNL
ncbi:MAG: gamma carbonic anhydrase family protein, partial [Gammaproteobacteria bacterium]|nr:gamma carbonic anhydrase family protein [Gammaproteobacteria bacterium]